MIEIMNSNDSVFSMNKYFINADDFKFKNNINIHTPIYVTKQEIKFIL